MSTPSNPTATPLVWLITGASSGLGLCLARSALAKGHKVIATSRTPSKTPELVEEIEQSGSGVWAELDVSAADLEEKLEQCVGKFGGRVDVLVNNAGYAVGGALEHTPLAAVRAQFETNFFGSVRTMQAVIPRMRAQSGGTIVNVTSTEGVSGTPGISAYGASKFALEGVTEAVGRGELAPFGIRTLLVEPGGMRTGFLEPARVQEVELGEHYKGGAVEMVMNAVRAKHGAQAIDPAKAADRVVEAVDGSGEGWPEGREKFLRLPLGEEMMDRLKGKIDDLSKTATALEGVAMSVNYQE